MICTNQQKFPRVKKNLTIWFVNDVDKRNFFGQKKIPNHHFNKKKLLF